MTLIFFLQSLVGLCVWMALAWVVQRLTKISAWVDAFWSFGVGLGALYAADSVPVLNARSYIIGGLIGFWSLRLGLHLVRRALQGHDDPRYAALAEKWGSKAGLLLFVFLQIQAVTAAVLVLAVRICAVKTNSEPDIFDLIGAAIIILGLAGESVADRQLAVFTRQNKGEKVVCDRGLWAWSRHPNYYFEWLVWVGVGLMAIDPNTGPLSYGWAGLAPLMMYRLLVHVSGIPPLEAHMRRSRGQAYDDYAARTSAFFLWPPRSKPRS